MKKSFRFLSALVSAAMLISFTAIPAEAKTTSKVISGINLTNKKKNASGSGWSWNYKTKTLTLSGVKIDAKTSAVTLPSGNVTVKLSGKNVISVKANSENATYGIYAKGDMTVVGSGSLECSSVNTLGVPGGLSADNLKLAGSGKIKVSTSGGNRDSSPKGVYVSDDFNITKGSLVVSVKNTNRDKKCVSYGILSNTGDVSIGSSSSVSVTVAASGAAVGTATNAGDISIAGKFVTDVGSLYDSSEAIKSAGDLALGGTSSIKSSASQYAGGLWADEKIAIKKAKTSIEISCAETAIPSEYVGNYAGYTGSSAYGIGCDGKLAASSSTIYVTAKASGFPTCGIFSYDNASFSRCKFKITCTSSGSSAYGLRTIGSDSDIMSLDNCTGSIKATSASILAVNALEVSGTSFSKNEHIGSSEFSGYTYYSVNKTFDTKFKISDNFKMENSAIDLSLS